VARAEGFENEPGALVHPLKSLVLSVSNDLRHPMRRAQRSVPKPPYTLIAIKTKYRAPTTTA
jgi:hypothetical protein